MLEHIPSWSSFLSFSRKYVEPSYRPIANAEVQTQRCKRILKNYQVKSGFESSILEPLEIRNTEA